MSPKILFSPVPVFLKVLSVVTVLLIASVTALPDQASANDDWDVIHVYGHRYATSYGGGGYSSAISGYTAEITFDRDAVMGGRRGSATQQRPEDVFDRCIADADKSFADCKYNVYEWYSQGLNSCDRAFARRFRGWSVGVEGLFGVNYQSASQMCRQDKLELRDQNLNKCNKWHADDVYECRTS